MLRWSVICKENKSLRNGKKRQTSDCAVGLGLIRVMVWVDLSPKPSSLELLGPISSAVVRVWFTLPTRSILEENLP